MLALHAVCRLQTLYCNGCTALQLNPLLGLRRGNKLQERRLNWQAASCQCQESATQGMLHRRLCSATSQLTWPSFALHSNHSAQYRTGGEQQWCVAYRPNSPKHCSVALVSAAHHTSATGL